jgi:hypothetical protein
MTTATLTITAYTRHELAGAAHFARNAALLVAAPFVALVYVLAAPFVGLGMLAWFAVRAMKERAA